MKNHILLISDCKISPIQSLLERYGLNLSFVSENEDIPGSFWGESEAGLISNTVFVRNDTPIHSFLHETCHYICMDNQRRQKLDTNAEGDYDEENAVCYLQILLAEDIPEMGKIRMMQDMNSWGYTFRLGSAENWFNKDADDAFNWLKSYQLLNNKNDISYKLRD